MWKPRTLLILVTCFAIIGALAFALAQPTEPTYHGHTLSYWLTGPHPGEQHEECLQAIFAIGTNAIPTLLHWINYEPTPWKKKLASIPFVQRRGWSVPLLYGPAREKRWRAFAILGTNAAPAIPALVKFMRDPTRPNTALSATITLGSLGEGALPYLAEALSDTNQPNHVEIIQSIRILRYSGVPATLCIATITKATIDTDPRVRLSATNAIRSLTEDTPPGTRY